MPQNSYFDKPYRNPFTLTQLCYNQWPKLDNPLVRCIILLLYYIHTPKKASQQRAGGGSLTSHLSRR